MSALNSGFGGCSALIVAQADIARCARKPSDQCWSQLITYPLLNALPALFGILVAGATFNFWGQAYWHLWDVLSAALDYYEISPASRGLVFLASFAFAVAILGTNMAANSLPLVAILLVFSHDGLTSAVASPLRFVGLSSRPVENHQECKVASDIFVRLLYPHGSFSAIYITDYFFVAKGKFSIRELYLGNSQSRYWYWKGWNMRAVASWVIGVVLPLPGFVATFGTVTIKNGATHTWNMGYVLSIIMSGTVYYLLSIYIPVSTIDKSLQVEDTAIELDSIMEAEVLHEQGKMDLVLMDKLSVSSTAG